MMRRWMVVAATGLALSFGAPWRAGAADAPARATKLPEGRGLAARYPGDEGIEKDPRVLFVEDFETGGIREIGERWGEAKDPQNMDLSPDVAPASPGCKSLHIRDNGHLYTHTKGVDTMYARFYVKFPPNAGYLHHFVFLIADRTPTSWPKGWAGSKPPGDQAFLSGIEPWGKWGAVPPPGAWHMYSYWQEMKPDGLGHYWGNFFDPPKDELIEPNRWYCVEAMVKANSKPDVADGEQAFWVDGRLVGAFKGFRWRSSDKLKLNSFWLEYYVSLPETATSNKDTAPNRNYEVSFDDIVVATEYIGPVVGHPKHGRKVATPSKSALLTPGMLLPAPGKVVFSENFDRGAGRFTGGEWAQQGGVNGSGALSFGAKGAECWNAFSMPVKDSTTIRLKLKPSADVSDCAVLIWSDKLRDNARYNIGSLKGGEWKTVEFRGIEARTNWAMDGPSLDGCVLNNLKLIFTGADGARVLLDDFEVRE